MNKANEIALEFVYNYVSREVDLKKMPLNGVKIATHLDEEIGKLRLMMSGYLAGNNFKPPVKISYPADWIQAIRARWLPDWWRKRHPVQMITETVYFYQMYPDYLDFPELGRSIIKQIHYNGRGGSETGDVKEPPR